MANTQQEFDSKYDAINAAHVLAHQLGLPAYAFDTIHGWHVSDRKPMLRYGKVIECHNGKEYMA